MPESSPAAFAWCFDHGWLHPLPTLCTAVAGTNAEEALAAKRERFGEAAFLYQLPSEQQLEVIDRQAETHKR
ncbi:hypothetical protein [Kitasatospora sp. NPDC088783]|uniref:hypothetical protein n=1 Tax=Kitasatospora sp. NPDC088783 TaxID=3364077 RepID=UPI003820E341